MQKIEKLWGPLAVIISIAGVFAGIIIRYKAIMSWIKPENNSDLLLMVVIESVVVLVVLGGVVIWIWSKLKKDRDVAARLNSIVDIVEKEETLLAMSVPDLRKNVVTLSPLVGFSTTHSQLR